MAEDSKMAERLPEIKVVYKLRDIKGELVEAWNTIFADKPYFNELIEVSKGDVFKDAPDADAIVSPANSFGFMDGGIDMVLSRHFGWNMSKRLRELIADEYGGEVLVGQAVIIPTNVSPEPVPAGPKIKWLISAPTMRVPMNVSKTANSYLAFRGIIFAVRKHNKENPDDPIRTVLCPGLGTAVGVMPSARCAYQMMQAFETLELGLYPKDVRPEELKEPWQKHLEMSKYTFE